jgi:hypothetical protein
MPDATSRVITCSVARDNSARASHHHPTVTVTVTAVHALIVFGLRTMNHIQQPHIPGCRFCLHDRILLLCDSLDLRLDLGPLS